MARRERLRAGATFQAALGHYRRLEDHTGIASALRALSWVARMEGDHELAILRAREALEHHRAADYPYGVATCFNAIGEGERFLGRLDEAEVSYRSALDMMTRIGAAETAPVRLNLVMVALARGRYEDAMGLLDGVRRDLNRRDRSRLGDFLDALYVPCAAARGDWEAWDRHLAAAEERLTARGAVSSDLATAVALASELATSAGEPYRAAAALALAERYRARLSPGR